jgi:hypothetical protein
MVVKKVSAKKVTKRVPAKKSVRKSAKRTPNRKRTPKVKRTRLLTAVKVKKGRASAAKRVRVGVLKKQLSNRKETRNPVDVNDLILEINGLAFAADDNSSGLFLTDKYTVPQLKSRLDRLRKKHGAIPHV